MCMINFNTANPLQPAVSVYKFMQPCLLFCGDAQWHMRRVRWTLTVKGATFKVWSNKFTALARPGEREREWGIGEIKCQTTFCLTQSKL